MANHTILLIDYEPKSIEKVRRPLTGFGYSVEVATDGIAGLEAFHRLKPDLVMIEAMIPKKHGFEVCQEIKKSPQGKRTPIIITTSVYKGRKYRNQAFHIHGCDEYLEKPLEEEQILSVCRRMLGDTDEVGDADLRPMPTPDELDPVVEPDPAYHHADHQAAAPPDLAPAPTLDDDELEILARLDSILPGSGSSSSAPAPKPAAMPAPPAPSAPPAPAASTMGGNSQAHSSRTMTASAVATPADEPAQNPYATSFLSSGQSSDLANAPAHGAVMGSEPMITVEEVEAEPMDESQVVSFESRKSKKKDKKAKKEAASNPSMASIPSPIPSGGGSAASAQMPMAAASVDIVGAPAPSELDALLAETPPSSRPWWISVGLAVVLIGAAVVLMYIYLGGLFTSPGR